MRRNHTDRRALRILGILCASLLGASAAHAQAASGSDTVTVLATNAGSSRFDIVSVSYNFGSISPLGGANLGGTQALAGVRGANGATFTAANATAWTARSAPPRFIRIHNSSTVSNLSWGTPDRLEIQIPMTNLPAAAQSCGYKTFTTVGDGGAAGCGAGNLVRNLRAGMGVNTAAGVIDFRLYVDDTDAAGDNTWMVTLTAVGL